MAFRNFEEKIRSHPNAFDMLYNNQEGVFGFPVPGELSNWRDEQEAWRKTAILQDMSFHMTELRVEGPDVYQFISSLGVNSFKTFNAMSAKQLVACNHDGYMIGDAILISEEENEITILGRPSAIHWAEFQIETGNFNVKISRKENPTADASKRARYRFQVQGPTADIILSKLNGGSLPEIKFFKMGRFKIGEHDVTALNHRMSGAPGYEFWGPMEEAEAVKALLFEAGEAHGLRQIGGRSYAVTALESGWFGGIVPAVYTGADMKSYREWLSADAAEGRWSLGGSYVTDDIEQLYVTPYDIGYGFMVKYDHDFVGRAALEAKSKGPHKKKVRLNWNADDVLDIAGSMMGDGNRYKYMEAPSANYSTYSADEVLNGAGDRIGHSIYPVYSANVRGWFSLATIQEEYAVDGQELTLTWGEPDGGSSKPRVERHIQKSVRVTVDAQPVKRD